MTSNCAKILDIIQPNLPAISVPNEDFAIFTQSTLLSSTMSTFTTAISERPKWHFGHTIDRRLRSRQQKAEKAEKSRAISDNLECPKCHFGRSETVIANVDIVDDKSVDSAPLAPKARQKALLVQSIATTSAPSSVLFSAIGRIFIGYSAPIVALHSMLGSARSFATWRHVLYWATRS